MWASITCVVLFGLAGVMLGWTGMLIIGPRAARSPYWSDDELLHWMQRGYIAKRACVLLWAVVGLLAVATLLWPW